MENSRIAALFEELADRLELLGESPFKARAYRTFAATARGLAEPIEGISKRGVLLGVEGVGGAIARKVEDLLATGTFATLERARAAVPAGLLDLLKIPGLGTKTVRLLWREANVTSLAELQRACEENRLSGLATFGKRKQERTLAALKTVSEGGGGVLLAVALDAARVLTEALRKGGAKRAALVGEGRRGVEIVRTMEMIVEGLSPSEIAKTLGNADEELLVEGIGDADSAVEVTLQARGLVRLHVVKGADWVRELLVRTGDEAHVRWLRDLAVSKGGLEEMLLGATSEEAVYRALGLDAVPAELREGASPHVDANLVAERGVRGVFHVHTDWSDGALSILAMAKAAAKAGNTYVGISDHSQAATYANGLGAARLREQAAALASARKKAPEIAILHGIEVDILSDGTLDLSNDVLMGLDFVIASVHTKFNMSSAEMTARLVRAVSHPLVTMLGHPTGRLLLGRSGYTFDLDAVARAAAANDTYFEINANAQRMDLAPPMVRRAALVGARFVINPDAHAARGFDDTQLGVMVARRAGVLTEQVLNTRGRDDIVLALAERKRRAKKRLP